MASAKSDFPNRAKAARKLLTAAEDAHTQEINNAEIQLAQAKSAKQSEIDNIEKQIQAAREIFDGEVEQCAGITLYGDHVVYNGRSLMLDKGVQASVETSGNIYTTTKVTGTSGGFGVGRAVVGGALAGPLGAAVGGATKRGSTTTSNKVHDERNLFIIIQNEYGYISARGNPNNEGFARYFVSETMNAAATYSSRRDQSEKSVKELEELKAQIVADTSSITAAENIVSSVKMDTAQVDQARAELNAVVSTGTAEERAKFEAKEAKFVKARQAKQLSNDRTHAAMVKQTELGKASNPQKQKTIALLLAIFLGQFGAYRFFKHQYGLGILYLFTGGLFFIGWIVDIVQAAIALIREYYNR